MRYFANPVNGLLQAAAADPNLGVIMTPRQGNRLLPDVPFCIDNNCGPGSDGQAGSGYPGDRAYLEFLSHLSAQSRRRCVFATAPDVLGDPVATIERSARFVYRVRAWFGLPVALVAQDGLEYLDIPWNWFDVLFIGGSTEWKLGAGARELVREAKANGKLVHMGRVNSLRRLRYATAIGCDSADGTFLVFAPTANLSRLQGWLRDVNQQGTLWEEAA
jgi:hypothetical protein